MPPTRLFINLNGGLVGGNSNDFADKLLMADFHLVPQLVTHLPGGFQSAYAYQLIHSNTNHVFGNNNGPSRTVLVGGRGRGFDVGGRVTNPETE